MSVQRRLLVVERSPLFIGHGEHSHRSAVRRLMPDQEASVEFSTDVRFVRNALIQTEVHRRRRTFALSVVARPTRARSGITAPLLCRVGRSDSWRLCQLKKVGNEQQSKKNGVLAPKQKGQRIFSDSLLSHTSTPVFPMKWFFCVNENEVKMK